MPRVPTVEGPTVGLNALPDAFQRTPDGVGRAQQIQGQQLQSVAQTGMQVADEFRKAADQHQRELDEFDQTRVDDALNRLKESRDDLAFNRDTGYTSQRGLAALQRSSGMPLAEEYTDNLKKVAQGLGDGLGNERQKRLFALRSNDVVTGFRGQVMQHEGREADAYVASVREGTIANAQNEAGRYWNDPARIDGALASMDAAVADLGRELGSKSATWIEARQRVEASKALTSAVGGALERNDYQTADALLKRYGERMTADDLVRARGLVDKHFDAGVAQQVATSVVQAVQPTIQPTDMDRVLNITVQSESGGNPNAVSPKGAKGLMQVMDATNKDPGFGVKPARDNSPAERVRVGRDYLGAMVKRYGGDLAKAWAAYNAGPGALDDALKRAQSPEMAQRGKLGQWLAFMPAETQDYVAKNLKAYEAGDGRPPMASLKEVHDAVRARVGDASPLRLRLALEESTRQYDESVKAVKQREDEGEANAQRWLAANGGRFNEMPASLRAAVPAAKIDNLLTFSNRVSKGVDTTNAAVYQQLSNPEFLRGLSDNEFFTLSTRELSESDRKHFVSQRAQLLKPDTTTAEKPGEVNGSAVKALVDTRLRELGLDPSPKDGSADAMRVGAIRAYMDKSVLQAQASAGKKFDDAALAKHVDGVFGQTDVVKGWISDKSLPMLTMQAGDIPGDIKDRLKADFKAAGIDKPTDGQLLGAYWTARSAQKTVRRIVPLAAGPK